MSARTYIALGLAALTATLVLIASVIDLFPDRDSAVREGRAALAEAIAAGTTPMIPNRDTAQLQAMLTFVVSRNKEMLSAAIRNVDGTMLASVGAHERNWVPMAQARSTDAQIQVPIMAGGTRWGQLELRYKPVSLSALGGIFHSPLLRFVLFVMLASFCAFYFYLAKVLNQLDPSKAIPGRVRAALDTLSEGLLVIDRTQKIVLANEAIARLLGRTPQDLLGTPITRLPWLVSGARIADASSQPWSVALARGTVEDNYAIGLVDGAGAHRSFIVNCAPVLGARGRPAGVLISLDDVTQLEENKAELYKAKQDAEAANQAKSEFLANVSHDIRTPMNAILGFTELLRRGYGRNQTDAKKYLETIHSSGKHLLDLINDILDLSKIESGQLEVESLSCAPHAIVREVVTVLGVKAQEKGISLDFRIEGLIPAQITSDPTCLRRVVTNLVGNAIKFTDRGGVAVILRLSNAHEPQLAIDVVDTGIGIAADKLEGVFEPFVQADSSVTRRFGGTGLGLTISRRFARALGGDIDVSSEPGKGSTFSVTVATGPLGGIRMLAASELDAFDGAAGNQQFRWKFSPAKVLVVDDAPENRELLRLVLTDAGLDIHEAENGRVGVEKGLRDSFDVILMDMQMPVLDGYAATRMLRDAGVAGPILALTANAMKGAEKGVIEAGCSGFLTKPINIDELLETLGALLGGVRELASSQSNVRSAPSSTAIDDDSGPDLLIRSRLADNPRLRPAIRKFTTRLNEQLQAFERAYQARDFAELANLAHWLKGAAGTVGFDDFTDPAMQLEEAAKESREADAQLVLSELHALAARLEAPDSEDTANVTV